MEAPKTHTNATVARRGLRLARELFLGGTLAMLCSVGTTACRRSEVSEQLARAITDGVEDTGHPYVGLLLIGAESGTAKTVCTATVVGQKTLLTAAHCCQPAENTLFQLNGKLYQVAKVTPHPSWDKAVSPYFHDIGVAVLASPISVARAEAASINPVKGSKVTLVGFGRTAADIKNEGTKRVASNFIASVATGYFTIDGTGNGVGNACQGDSGGPVLTGAAGKEVVLGVISAVLDTCGGTSYHATVSSHLSWLVSTANGDIFQPGVKLDGQSTVPDAGSGSAERSAISPSADQGGTDGEPAPGRRPDEGCTFGGLASRSSLGSSAYLLAGLGTWLGVGWVFRRSRRRRR